jgi:hypothetical protein
VGIPTPARPRPDTRGYDTHGKEALENFDSVPQTLDQNSNFNAASRQATINAQHEADQLRASQPPGRFEKDQGSYVTNPGSLAPVGRGETHKSSEGNYYVDRNGDGASDLIIQYRDGKRYVDYGDGNGFQPYDPRRELPAPPVPISKYRIW